MDNKELSLQIEELANSIKALSEKQNSQYTDIMLQLKELNDNFVKRTNIQDDSDDGYEDDIYENVAKAVKELDKVSVSFIQRRFSVGYARAASLVDQLERDGLITKKTGRLSSRMVVKEETK